MSQHEMLMPPPSKQAERRGARGGWRHGESPFGIKALRNDAAVKWRDPCFWKPELLARAGEIIDAVCRELQVLPFMVAARPRFKIFRRARMLVAVRLKNAGFSNAQIGGLMGRNQSLVVYLLKTAARQGGLSDADFSQGTGSTDRDTHAGGSRHNGDGCGDSGGASAPCSIGI